MPLNPSLMKDVEKHPLKPFLPKNAKLLMLGSFPPPQKRWCMHFYYPNFINDMWRILGKVFFDDRDYFVLKEKKSFDKEKIIDFLNTAGIGIYDTAIEVRRLKGNASDAFLEVVKPTDVKGMLTKLSQCKAVVTTGTLATKTLCEMLGAEDYLHFDYEGASMTARVDPRTTARTGDTVKFALDADKIHVFDKETEKTITN